MNSKAYTKPMLLGLAITFGIFLVYILGLIIWLKWQINNYSDYWQKQATAKKEPNALTYVALGDSAAQGIGASRPQNGYVGLLAAKISAKTNRPVHIVNLSVTGAKVSDVLNQQLPKLETLDLKPDVITLEIGSNDLGKFNSAEFRRDFEAILTQLPPETVVADIAFFGSGRHFKREPQAKEASAIVAELTKQNNMRLAPLHEYTTKRDSWRIHSPDLFHPSNYGYGVWAQAFWEVLESQL